MKSFKHEAKACPRCEAIFECKVGDVANCQCAEVPLNYAAKNFLTKTQYDCLCKKCLAELSMMVNKAETSDFPRDGKDLVEGLHYYKEKGMWVFTEFYHLQRGYCCKNGCRHCAYGFKKKVAV